MKYNERLSFRPKSGFSNFNQGHKKGIVLMTSEYSKASRENDAAKSEPWWILRMFATLILPSVVGIVISTITAVISLPYDDMIIQGCAMGLSVSPIAYLLAPKHKLAVSTVFTVLNMLPLLAFISHSNMSKTVFYYSSICAIIGYVITIFVLSLAKPRGETKSAHG